MNKKWLLLGAGVVIISVSIATTMVIVNYSGPKEHSASSYSRRYDVFEGFSLCEDAIKNSIGGKVITLDTDDRAAKYDRHSNTNILFFVAKYQKKMGLFGGSVAPEEKVFVSCHVSARTNQIEFIRLRPAEEEDYTEVRRQK